MIDDKEFIAKLTSLVPFLSMAFIVYSVVDIFFYFQFFNFNILPYLEIAEFIPLTLFDFVINLIGTMVFFVSYLFIKLFVPKKTLVRIAGFVGFSLLFFLILDLVNYKHSIIFDTDLYLITMFLSSIAILFIVKEATGPIGSKFSFIAGLIVLLIVGNAYYRAYNKFYDVMYCDHYIGTYLVPEKGGVIMSDTGHFYIGKCKSYFIFYEKNTKGIDLYPASSISHAYILSK